MDIEKKQFIKGIVKSVDDGVVTVVASDETIDRDGDVLGVNMWKTDNFLKNPVMLYGHDMSKPPFGRWDISIEGRQLIARGTFSEGKAGRKYKKLVDERILSAVSVGFLNIRDERGNITGRELLEISWVAVPSNPNALRKSLNVERKKKLRLYRENLKTLQSELAIDASEKTEEQQLKELTESILLLKSKAIAITDSSENRKESEVVPVNQEKAIVQKVDNSIIETEVVKEKPIDVSAANQLQIEIAKQVGEEVARVLKNFI